MKIAYGKSGLTVDIPSIALEAAHDLTVTARDGHTIPIHIYTARETSWADPLFLLVYFHGGDLAVGSIETHDQLCRSLVAKSGTMVLSVDYRLGPDWKFPTAVNNTFDVLQWMLDEASTMDADPVRIAFDGDSAGRTLVAVNAIEVRNRGLAPALQLLVYPDTTAREPTPPHRELAEGYLLTQDMIHRLLPQYLRSNADRDDWRLIPLDAGGHDADMIGVCSARIATAGFDPTRDAGISYANKLYAVEVPAELKLYEGMIRDFFRIGRFILAIGGTHYDVADALRRVFGTETESL